MFKSAEKFFKKFGFKLSDKLDEAKEKGLGIEDLCSFYAITKEEADQILEAEQTIHLYAETKEAIELIQTVMADYSLSKFRKDAAKGLLKPANNETGSGSKTYYLKEDVLAFAKFIKKTDKELFEMFKKHELGVVETTSEEVVVPNEVVLNEEEINALVEEKALELYKANYENREKSLEENREALLVYLDENLRKKTVADIKELYVEVFVDNYVKNNSIKKDALIERFKRKFREGGLYYTNKKIVEINDRLEGKTNE